MAICDGCGARRVVSCWEVVAAAVSWVGETGAGGSSGGREEETACTGAAWGCGWTSTFLAALWSEA